MRRKAVTCPKSAQKIRILSNKVKTASPLSPYSKRMGPGRGASGILHVPIENGTASPQSRRGCSFEGALRMSNTGALGGVATLKAWQDGNCVGRNESDVLTRTKAPRFWLTG